MTTTGTVATEPEVIKAIPLRHYGRWIAAAIVIILVGLFIYGAATNDAYDWSTYRKYLFDQRISQAAVVTLELTVLAMILGIILGVTLAVMRLSPNPVLKSTAWVYLWIFRGTPVYVQLVFWGLFTSIYRQVDIGIPFAVRLADFNLQGIDAAFTFAVIGLGLNEAAYMAEIVRAGISSVGRGADRGLGRPGHDLVADDAANGVAASHASDHPADRQRGDQHAQDHVAGDRGTAHDRSLLEGAGHLGCELPADPAAASARPPGICSSPAS